MEESQDKMIFGDREGVWIGFAKIVGACHEERRAQIDHVAIVQMIRVKDCDSQGMAMVVMKMRVGVDGRERVCGWDWEILNCVLFKILSEGSLVLGEVPVLTGDHQNGTAASSTTILITKRVHP
jgi:hypothetical protein